MNLINSIALIRQHQKPMEKREDGTEYILADIEDIKIANDLATEYITKNLDYLSPPAKNLYETIRELVLIISEQTGVETEDIQVSRRQIMDYSGWSEWQIRVHTKELVELEYLQQVQGKQGKRCCYKLIEEIDYELPKIDIGINLPEEKKEEKQKTGEKTLEKSKIAEKWTKLRDFVKLRD